jgi:hypothetical protein
VKYQYNNGSPTVLIKSPLSSLQLPQWTDKCEEIQK